MLRPRRPRVLPPLLVRAALLALVALVLAPPMLGRAGYQLVEEAMAARIFPVHLHGVAGETDYIARYGTWQGFVHDHCHDTEARAGQQYTPAQMSAAAVVIGPALCGDVASLPLPVAPVLVVAASHADPPAAQSPTPDTPPPEL